MKIAVNTRLLLPGRLEGIGWFTFETLRRITEWHPEHQFIFIFDRKPDPQFIFGPNVQAVVAHPQARHPLLWYLFFEFGVAAVLRKHKPDIFLSPDGWLSLRARTLSLAVIHDLNFEAHPQWVPRHIAWYYHRYFPKFAARATRIATVSEYTKADLSKRYGIPGDRIDVVYNGANPSFAPLNEKEIADVRKTYTQGAPYFLFVGLIHPRKNLENQLRAFMLFKQQHGGNMKFLVVGSKHWWSTALEELSKRGPFSDDIIFAGRKDMHTLTRLYGAAFALSYVSHFEGFGIPILEALLAEIPVITSTETSMPEVCGDAGVTVDPNNPEAIAEAMGKLYTDKAFREKLIEKGRVQRTKFSWDKTAAALWQSIEKMAESIGK